LGHRRGEGSTATSDGNGLAWLVAVEQSKKFTVDFYLALIQNFGPRFFWLANANARVQKNNLAIFAT
jgi:hypothetical protein